METLADKLKPDPKPKRKVLIIIDADPRTNPRAAEAVRLAGGVCVWEQVEVSVVLHHAAAHALGDAAADMPEGKIYKQFLLAISLMVARGRIELPTRGFSVRCSTN